MNSGSAEWFSFGVLSVSGGCGCWRVLTLADLALLLDVPGVERRPLLVLHGRPFVEVLGEVGLVQSGGLYHLPLGEVVLLHVTFHHFSNMPGILPVTGTAHVSPPHTCDARPPGGVSV